MGWEDVRKVALEVHAFLEELGLRGWPKTSGSRGTHINVRIEPRWTFDEVRRAALALSRFQMVERGRHGVFLDYNQNAKDRTTASPFQPDLYRMRGFQRRSHGKKFPIATWGILLSLLFLSGLPRSVIRMRGWNVDGSAGLDYVWC